MSTTITARGPQAKKKGGAGVIYEKDIVPTTEENRGCPHISNRVDVDIILSVLGVGNERLDEELPQNTRDMLDLLNLPGALGNPGLGFRPALVQGQETALASPLDQLVRLRDELGIRVQ